MLLRSYFRWQQGEEKWAYCKSISKQKLTRLADGLEVNCERKRGVKITSRVLAGAPAIYSNERAVEKASLGVGPQGKRTHELC